MRRFQNHPVRRVALGAAILLCLPTLFAVAQDNSGATASPLAGTQWQLVVPYWDLGTRARVSAPTLRFDTTRASASVGCNAMSGTYSTKREALKVGALLSTKMACGAPLDALESRYASALKQATKWQLSRDGRLLLLHTGQEPLVFARQ